MESELVLTCVFIVMSLCHLLASLVIAIGVIKTLIIFLKDALFGKAAASAIREGRLEFGHALSLSLGFLIGASILKSTVAPTWTEIGQLACIIAIRTTLNFFLVQEINNHASFLSNLTKSVEGDLEPDNKK